MMERRTAAAHVFVESVASPILNTADEHHLKRVLRVRDGEMVSTCDGRGAWRICRLSGDVLEPISELVHHETPPVRPITIAFGLTKGDKPDVVVQKLTEIGVDQIVPVFMERSVVRWDADKVMKNLERLNRIAREASMQSRRTFLPRVHEPSPSLATVLKSEVMQNQWGIVAVAEPGGSDRITDVSAMIIGPEGGFSSVERALVTSMVGLPGGILRAETAALAAGVLLAHCRDVTKGHSRSS